jgi:hypothetical protein
MPAFPVDHLASLLGRAVADARGAADAAGAAFGGAVADARRRLEGLGGGRGATAPVAVGRGCRGG